MLLAKREALEVYQPSFTYQQEGLTQRFKARDLIRQGFKAIDLD
jgi:hypothetical protein